MTRHPVIPSALAVGLLALMQTTAAFERVPEKPLAKNWEAVAPQLAEKLPALEFWKTLEPPLPEKYFYYRPSLYLWVLRYPIEAVAERATREFRRAVESFQRDLGHRRTGRLTIAEYVELERRAARMRSGLLDPWLGRLNAELLPDSTSKLIQVSDTGDVAISGVVVPESLRGVDDSVEPPETGTFASVQLQCLRSRSLCTRHVVGVIWLDLFADSSPLLEPPSLEQWSDLLDISEWTGQRLVARTEGGDSGQCTVVLFDERAVYFGSTVNESDDVGESSTPSTEGHLRIADCLIETELFDRDRVIELWRKAYEETIGKAATRFISDWEQKMETYHKAVRETRERSEAKAGSQ